MIPNIAQIKKIGSNPVLFLKAMIPVILLISLTCVLVPKNIAADYTLRMMQISLFFGFVCALRAAQTHVKELRKTFLFLGLFIFFMLLSNISIFWDILISTFGAWSYLGLFVAGIAYIMLITSCTYMLKVIRVKRLHKHEWIILGTMFIMGAIIVLFPLLKASNSSLDLVVSVLFRFFDVMITMMLLPVILLYRHQSNLESTESITFTITVIGIILSTIGDWLFEMISGISHQELATMFHTGSLLDSLYLFSYLLVALGLFVHINYGAWSLKNIDVDFKLQIKGLDLS